MTTTLRFREFLLAAMGLSTLLPAACQPYPGVSIDAGDQGSGNLGEIAGANPDGSAEADAGDGAGKDPLDGQALVDGASTDLVDGSGLVDGAKPTDTPAPPVDNGAEAANEAGSTTGLDSCTPNVRCYGAAAVKAAIEYQYCASKDCPQAAWPPKDAEGADACQPTVYSGPLPPAYCPSGGLFSADVCEFASDAWVQGDQCCYSFCTTCICGRPLWIEGELRVPALILADSDGAEACNDPVQLAIAQAWRGDAQDEQAAIASFHRLGL